MTGPEHYRSGGLDRWPRPQPPAICARRARSGYMMRGSAFRIATLWLEVMG